MRVTVLIDNISNDSLLCEWGLSFHIEHGGCKYLLDTGGSDSFLKNAASLGIDLSEVDHAVLSHAHWDHSNGTDAFMGINSRADLLISPDASENCYSRHSLFKKYIGLPKGLLDRYPQRIRRPRGISFVEDGVWIVPHNSPCPPAVARASHLYVRDGFRLMPDDFKHEQSLVFDLPEGLVVFNSCSHSGPEAIVSEVLDAFPGREVLAYFGGLHLSRKSDQEVRAFAGRMSKCPVRMFYTGHCTGKSAFHILEDALDGRVSLFFSGMVIDL